MLELINMATNPPVRTLVLCDDLWHPAKMVRRGLSPLADPDFAFTFYEENPAWAAARLNGYRLVVLAKANVISGKDKRPWLAPDLEPAFLDYVRQGNGLLVVHGGIAGYEKLPAMRAMIGGAFLHHPPQCAVTMEPKAGHPLTAGVGPFTVTDEHYQVALDDPRADVFLHSRSEHGLQPAGWNRAEGEGRVCVLTPGHNVEVWQCPSFQTLLRNALDWTGRVS
jgi:uncharacterized protein